MFHGQLVYASGYENTSSILAGNSEAGDSELPENHEEMFLLNNSLFIFLKNVVLM